VLFSECDVMWTGSSVAKIHRIILLQSFKKNPEHTASYSRRQQSSYLTMWELRNWNNEKRSLRRPRSRHDIIKMDRRGKKLMCVGWTYMCAARIYLHISVRGHILEYRNLGLKSRRVRVSGGLLRMHRRNFSLGGGGGWPCLILKIML